MTVMSIVNMPKLYIKIENKCVYFRIDKSIKVIYNDLVT